MSTGKQTSQGRAANLTWRGVMVNAVVADRKVASVASDMFKMARKCESLDEFLAKTQMEEDWVQSEEAGQMRCIETPKCWTQAKSDIKAAMKLGFDLTKFPSYHKLKAAKVAANKAAKDTQQQEDTSNESQQERAPRTGGETKERNGNPDNSLAEALANGDVVDAKSTELVPADLRQLINLLGKVGERSELRRAKLRKQFETACQQELSNIGNERRKGNQRAAS